MIINKPLNFIKIKHYNNPYNNFIMTNFNEIINLLYANSNVKCNQHMD